MYAKTTLRNRKHSGTYPRPLGPGRLWTFGDLVGKKASPAPTEAQLLADEIAAYREHGQRAAQNGWRIVASRAEESTRFYGGLELAVPAETPVLLPNAVLAWTTGEIFGERFVVRLGHIFGPAAHVSTVIPCTEENLPTRYAAALATQLSEALGQIADNDEDDALALRAIRMQVQANAITTGLQTGTY